ncbi:hypothetical protein [Caenibius sp. WL]|uniref:hypothetical protein n=1 Tax=Caenibius sp. WL TaxID=2872646 RepID=UPI001C9975A5|nr:hypothetical protein [Caenibius sp. WL]QZP09130.1 hypothetical protein K5X80_05010 [Caenibius sp. WL]
MQSVKPSQKKSVIAINREDFMKRWFAIALSVGFATALANMPWLKYGVIFEPSLPVDWEQIEQLARLFVAAFATVLSWDGYFRSIENKPIEDSARFFIDVFLVFLYLFLLLTSKFSYFWLWIHATAFLFYVAWDFFSIRKYRDAYINPGAAEDFAPSIKGVYVGSLGDDPQVYRGPAVTLMWPIFFWVLPLSYHFALTELERAKPITTFVYAFWVLCGLVAYRHDKNVRLPFWSRFKVIFLSVLGVLGSGLILRLIG